MSWPVYLFLTGIAFFQYVLVWYFSPRAGVWLDWFNLVVDVCMTIALLQMSGRSESPLAVLVYIWMFAMVTVNGRRGNNQALYFLAALGILVLATGSLGAEDWLSFMSIHTMGISLFVFTSMTLMDERRSNQLDPLTGVLNRRAGLERLSEKVQQGRSFDIAYIDLKGFKTINDTYGHAVGDEVLCGLAGRLAGSVRAGDIVMRLGGDEFLVTGPTGDLAARLKRVFRSPLRTSSGMMNIAGDVGIVNWKGETADIEALLGRADSEMYRMKHAVNRVDSRLPKEMSPRGSY